MTKHILEFDNDFDYKQVLCSQLSFWTNHVQKNLQWLNHPLEINISYFKPAKEAFHEFEKYAQLLEEFEKEERNEEDE